MFGKKKNKPAIDPEQLELIKNAQRRIKQKKRLYNHFSFFLIGSIVLIIANLIVGVANTTRPFGIDWSLLAVGFWLLLLLYHTFNVFVTKRLLSKEWEKGQLEKLVALQRHRIEKLKSELQKETNEIMESEADKISLSSGKEQVLTIIAAVGENNAIGKDNQLIWHLRDDLQHFKKLTSGHCIIMGRKTFESFTKPLPNRTHIVITKQADFKAPDGVIIVNSLDDALDAAKHDKQPFIIGGGEIYKQALPYADKIELTKVHANFEDADTFFPELDPTQWIEVSNINHKSDANNDYSFSFITYVKKQR